MVYNPGETVSQGALPQPKGDIRVELTFEAHSVKLPMVSRMNDRKMKHDGI